MKKTKFKVELEIEVEYNMASDNQQITPYTLIEAWINDNAANIKPTVGKITDVNPIKMTRLEN